MIKLQQSQALTSHFESFWSIVLGFSLVKMLLSWNFSQNCVRVNFTNFHTVWWFSVSCTLWKHWHFWSGGLFTRKTTCVTTLWPNHKNREQFFLLKAQCGNYGNLLSHLFSKNFMKTMLLLNKLLKS